MARIVRAGRSAGAVQRRRRSGASAASSVRLATPTLAKTWDRWVLTVLRDMKRRTPMSGLLWPSGPPGAPEWPMATLPDALHRSYSPRRGAFVSDERFDGWQLKLYGLADPEKGVSDALLETTRALVRESVPPVGSADGPYGAGFAIAHDAAFPIALIYWWQGVNELHQRVHVGHPGEPTALELMTLTPAGCVYELAIVDFERRAWIEDVMGNAAGPDLDRYLERRFDGLA